MASIRLTSHLYNAYGRNNPYLSFCSWDPLLFLVDVPVDNDVLLNCFFRKQEWGQGPYWKESIKQTVATKYKVLLNFALLPSPHAHALSPDPNVLFHCSFIFIKILLLIAFQQCDVTTCFW